MVISYTGFNAWFRSVKVLIGQRGCNRDAPLQKSIQHQIGGIPARINCNDRPQFRAFKAVLRGEETAQARWFSDFFLSLFQQPNYRTNAVLTLQIELIARIVIVNFKTRHRHTWL